MAANTYVDGGWGDDGASFVTLAKAGGRKDLLQHIEYSKPIGQERVEYSTVDWFAHPSPPPPQQSSSPPHTITQPSIIQWPSSLKDVKEKKKRRQDITQMKKLKASEIKLPKIEPAVDMVQLLAMDYQKEWLQEREQRALELKKQARERRAVQKKKLEEHTMRARHISGVEARDDTERPRFIMKRFANVPSRVKIPSVSPQKQS